MSHTSDNEIRVWDEQGTCVFFTEQVVVKSVKVIRLPREREAFLGANIRRLDIREKAEREGEERRHTVNSKRERRK